MRPPVQKLFIHIIIPNDYPVKSSMEVKKISVHEGRLIINGEPFLELVNESKDRPSGISLKVHEFGLCPLIGNESKYPYSPYTKNTGFLMSASAPFKEPLRNKIQEKLEPLVEDFFQDKEKITLTLDLKKMCEDIINEAKAYFDEKKSAA